MNGQATTTGAIAASPGKEGLVQDRTDRWNHLLGSDIFGDLDGICQRRFTSDLWCADHVQFLPQYRIGHAPAHHASPPLWRWLVSYSATSAGAWHHHISVAGPDFCSFPHNFLPYRGRRPRVYLEVGSMRMPSPMMFSTRRKNGGWTKRFSSFVILSILGAGC